MWLKYRHKWASGISNWEWHFLNTDPINEDDAYVEEVLEELNGLYSYSDKYRGLDYEVVSFPPPEIVEKHIENRRKAILWQKEQINYCEKILPECFIREIMES